MGAPGAVAWPRDRDPECAALIVLTSAKSASGPSQPLVRAQPRRRRPGRFQILQFVALPPPDDPDKPRDELVALVWPNTIVEESNLKVNVAALRRALGEGRLGLRYIATVSGRGYRFVAPVELSEQGSSPALRNTAPAYPHNLLVALTRAIGRADTIDALLKQLPPQRKAWVPLGDSRWPRCDRCCARMDQQPRGILVLGGVAAHQRRALPPAGVGSGRGGSLLAGTRIGPSPERTAVGIARGHEPSPALHQNDGPTRLKNCYLQSTAGLPRALRRQIS